MRLAMCFLAISSALYSLPSSAQQASDSSFLPPGYEIKSFESKWLGPGNNREDVCAGMVRRDHPNRPYMVMSTNEESKFRIPEFRIDAQYKYYCTVMLGPN